MCESLVLSPFSYISQTAPQTRPAEAAAPQKKKHRRTKKEKIFQRLEKHGDGNLVVDLKAIRAGRKRDKKRRMGGDKRKSRLLRKKQGHG